MPDVENIKATVCKDQPVAGCAPRGGARQELSGYEHFLIRVYVKLLRQRPDQLMLPDGDSSNLGDYNTRGHISELCRSFYGESTSDSKRQGGNDGISGARDIEDIPS